MHRAGRHFFVEFTSALVFSIVLLGILYLLEWDEGTPLVRILVYWLIVLPRFGIAVLGFFLLEKHDRVLSVEDATARSLFRSFLGLIVLIGVGLR